MWNIVTYKAVQIRCITTNSLFGHFDNEELFEGQFFSPYRWTNWFLHAVTVGSNPAHSTIFTPVFVLHCEVRERDFTTD